VAIEVVVPEVGEIGMEVTFVRWLKADGDYVRQGEPLFEVDTAKAVVEVEAFADGRLAGTRARPGELVRPHQVLAFLLAEGEELPAAPAPASAQLAPGSRVAATPKAKRLAADLGLDLATLAAGSGPGGLITEHDIRGASASPRSDSVRTAIAASTVTSWRTIPHFYLTIEADVGKGLAGARPTGLVCSAIAWSLRQHPELNLAWDADRLTRRDSVDLGLLVDTPRGLLLPVIRGADQLNLAAMQEAIEAAAARARAGQLRSDDYGPRSLSVSNLGMFSIDRFAGVIAAPDVMLMAIGRLRTVPRWESETWRPHRVTDLTLSVDHRAIDGAAGARFLSTLERVLADPGMLT
jgi:pyruvate dehydrogenase E2 component (dihydrolipoamide acetyltransferase)